MSSDEKSTALVTQNLTKALSEVVVEKVGTVFSEQLLGSLSKINLDSISQTRSDIYEKEELRLILLDLRDFLVTKYAIVSEDFILHLSMIIVRLSTTSCSDKYTFGKSERISYTISDIKYTLYDCDLFPCLRALCKKHSPSTKNGVRKLASSCEALLVTLGHLRPHLFDSARSTRAGVPLGKGWLASDFISGIYPDITENERAISLRARDVTLSRGSADKGVLINLYDLVQ
ncbi:minor coat protein [Fig virus B]|uniref:PdCP n=1 Tax=Fig closterovirus 1 TaxID=2809010 RepID=A0A8A0XZB1_9CLOS|nr:minor coat protein [Fig virus B]QSQ86314.1 pdCP [Fig closterovirus 1]